MFPKSPPGLKEFYYHCKAEFGMAELKLPGKLWHLQGQALICRLLLYESLLPLGLPPVPRSDLLSVLWQNSESKRHGL